MPQHHNRQSAYFCGMQSIFAQILALVLLTLAVSLVVFFMVRYLQRRRVLLPLEIQASERLLLLVERFKPEGLLLRTPATAESPVQIRQALIAGINLEWEHNLSQQLYVTPAVWLAVAAARDEVMLLIRTTPVDAAAAEPAAWFRQRLLERAAESGLPACGRALRLLHQNRY